MNPSLACVKLTYQKVGIRRTNAMMNLIHWRLLQAVADAGSITHAAAQVGMTQSGASQAIAQLEDSMGAPLFLRERRRTVPTALGLQAVAEARLMLASLDRLRALARQARGEAGGTLRLASLPIVFSTILPPLLRRFRQAHPGIEVVPLEASDHEIETLLAAGTVDLGVVLNAPPDSGVCPLGEDDWVAVVPAAHPLARGPGGGVALADLAAQPFVLATGGAASTRAAWPSRPGWRCATCAPRSRNGPAPSRWCEGVGVTLAPELTLPENRRGLRVLPLTAPVRRRFGLAASRAAVDTPAVRALFATLQAHDGLA